jgi:uncharacterized membrane protein
MGTEINACISYRLPAGDLGMMAAKLFNPAIEKMMRDDLRNFKQLLETGEAPSRAQRSSPSPGETRDSRQEYSVSGY